MTERISIRPAHTIEAAMKNLVTVEASKNAILESAALLPLVRHPEALYQMRRQLADFVLRKAALNVAPASTERDFARMKLAQEIDDFDDLMIQFIFRRTEVEIDEDDE
jgi:hypothetical protein